MIFQSQDSLTSTTNESKYGSFYESLILSCISKVSNESIHTGEYNIYKYFVEIGIWYVGKQKNLF